MTKQVTVVGLGPGGPDLTTAGALAAVADARHLVLRTARHPAAEPLVAHETCDDLYEAGADFDAVYASIVDRLATRAADGPVTYAVPGSPYVLERTVEHLVARDDLAVDIVAGMSFLDLAWGRLGVDPVEAGVRLVDGHRFASAAADATGPLLVAHCHAAHVLSDIKLAYDDDEPAGAVILQRLGLPDETITEVDWADLDRAVEADHLTSIYVPAVTAPVAAALVRFDELVRTLRANCPWDREQTHESLTRYAIEETFELVDAIDRGSVDDLEEELGDVLFQVFFHATIAAESGAFTLADVATGIHDKLYRRHPHVFGDAASGTDEIVANWEQIKAAEKQRDSILDGIPPGLPSLLEAHKVLSKAERIGATGVDPVDPPDGRALGEYLLGLVAGARRGDADADSALRAAVRDLRARVVEHEQREQ